MVIIAHIFSHYANF